MFPLARCEFSLSHVLAVSTGSTSQREAAWARRRSGGRGRMRPRPSKRKELSTARAATALASSPWISTWPASTCWRANSPGRRHFLQPPPPCFFPQSCNLTLSERRVLQETLDSRTSLHLHAPTKVGWSCGSKMVVVICIDLSREQIERVCQGGGSSSPDAPVP